MGADMARWNLVIPEETDRSVRLYLARTGGKKGDLSKFVEEVVRGEILRQTIAEIRERNRGLTAEEAQALADEAVAWARGQGEPPRPEVGKKN
jgi:hypothetical protein